MPRRWELSSHAVGGQLIIADHSSAGASTRNSAFYQATGARKNRLEPGFSDRLGLAILTEDNRNGSRQTARREKEPIDVGKKNLSKQRISGLMADDADSPIGTRKRRCISPTYEQNQTSLIRGRKEASAGLQIPDYPFCILFQQHM